MRSAWMLAATIGLAACVGPEPTLPTNCTMCGDLCVDFKVDPNHCGGCDTVCAAGLVCSAGTCAVGAAWPSVISPGTDLDGLSRPSISVETTQGLKGLMATPYVISTPFPSTIYYRNDGEIPIKGASGTLSAKSPALITTTNPESPDPVVFRWFAEYTLADGTFLRERVRRYTHSIDEAKKTGAGERVLQLSFRGPEGNWIGASIVVHPGEKVVGAYTVQVWRAPGSGAIILQSLWLEGTQLACGGDGLRGYPGNLVPGQPLDPVRFEFDAPMERGRYRVKSQTNAVYTCAGLSPDPKAEVVGEVIVL